MAVELKLNGNAAIVMIDRQAALNALNLEIIEQLSAAIDEVEARGAQFVIFAGAGPKAFSAGADVKELEVLDDKGRRSAIAFGQKTFAKLDVLPAISIAAIHGFALGGGLELAMACTFRVATPRARMGLPEAKLGLIPGYGGTQRLPRLVGPSRAAEIIMSGRTIDAEEAERVGLVSAIIHEEDPVRAGLHFAARFDGASPSAAMIGRAAIEASTRTTLSEGLQIEADLVVKAFQTGDASEGISAFTEKRTPRFAGRPVSDRQALSA